MVAALPVIVASFAVLVFQSQQNLFEQPTATTIVLFHAVSVVTMAFALTPTTFIAVLSGYFFSWYGLLGVLAAYPMAALIGLGMGRLAKDRILGDSFYQEPRVQQLLGGVRKDEFAMIVLTRLSPVLPFAMINVALSALRLDRRTYVIATMIGMLPRTLLFFFAGRQADELWSFVKDPSFAGASRLVPVVLIRVSTFGLLWVMRRAFRGIVTASE
jgi:uncharacterized membrane protein YdjX (TVP38/TMEM64 family)